mgnify:CR=1 FL=1
MSLFYMKVYNVENRVMVVVCDEEILGKVFREGDVVLDISPAFYGGKKVGIEEVVDAVNTADIVVLSGRRIIEELDKKGLVLKEFALAVEGQLHVQIIKEVYG